jgi:hypothetical protein
VTVHRRNHGKGHSYTDDAGLKIPGVTTLVGDGLPKKALQKWAIETVADYYVDHRDELAAMLPSEARKVLTKAPYATTSKAAARGTQVHELAERLIRGEEVAIPEGMDGYVRAAVTFIDEFDVIPVAQEFTVYSETWRWAGTCDLVADLLDPDDPEPDPALRGRVRWLLDAKTKEKESGVFGDAALQLAPYRCAERMVDPATGEDRPMIEVDRCGIVQLYKDGTYRLIPVEADLPEYTLFQYVQQVALWLDTNRSLVGEPITPPRTSAFRLVESSHNDPGETLAKVRQVVRNVLAMPDSEVDEVETGMLSVAADIMQIIEPPKGDEF